MKFKKERNAASLVLHAVAKNNRQLNQEDIMELKGWHTEHVKVDLSDSTIIEVAITILKKRHKLENVDGIDKGRMYEIVEYATSHSWLDKEDRGEPTENQLKTIQVIEGLKQNLHNIM